MCTKFLFNNTYFSSNNEYYRQIDGTPMGSPISPLFVDIVMDDLETYCLRSLMSTHYFTSVTQMTQSCALTKNTLIQSQKLSTYIKINYNLPMNQNKTKKINFLDMTLIRYNNTIITDWFNKPTSSDRLINFRYNLLNNKKFTLFTTSQPFLCQINNFIRKI